LRLEHILSIPHVTVCKVLESDVEGKKQRKGFIEGDAAELQQHFDDDLHCGKAQKQNEVHGGTALHNYFQRGLFVAH